jgi:hypothetical protein
MAINLPLKSKNKLEYRPHIEFVEPPQEPEDPRPVQQIGDDFPLQKQQDELLNLVNAVDVLGAALQSRINERAKNIKIKLDPNVDAQVIQAMCRMFSKDDENDCFGILDNNNVYITYEHYKQARETICKYGADLAVNIKPKDEIFNESDLTDGSLRPELSDKAQVVEPLDMAAFQENLFKLLVRHIWKNFFRKPLKKLPGIGRKIPKQLPGTKLNRNFKAQLEKAKQQGVKVIGL